MNKSGSLIGGILLVAGTSIGGGMLALPVLTSIGGFIPSLVIYILCWAFMASTGLLFLEISSWMEKDSNIVSMADRTLGSFGKIVAWVVYLFLFYCLTIAYVVGCGDLVSQFFQESIPEWAGSLIFVFLFGPIVYAGTRVAGPLNMVLMLGLGIFYLVFVFLGWKHVNYDLLKSQNWPLSLLALPISFTAFAYQGIIPTLVNYLNHDIKKTRLAILIGSFLPLITYIIWQWLILGIIPTNGPGGLAEALKEGNNAVHPLKNFIQTPWVYIAGQFFAFFALVTSFLGVTLGLLDFLADGLKVKKNAWGKFWLCLTIFIPPLFIGYTYPHIFLIALDYAGGFGCAILLGLLPILMVWSGRYRLGLQSIYSPKGGKFFLVILLLFVLFELGCEIFISFA